MIGNKYNYAFIDGSFLLTRNLWVATKGKKPDQMEVGEVIRITIQTINKLYRDWGITSDKILLIFDEWDKGLANAGYIRSYMIKDYVQYKGSRKFVTEQTIADMKADPNTKPEDLEKAIHELASNKIKFQAKKIIREEFKNIGIPYFSWPGYEFDDIATLASFGLNGKTSKPNVIVTKDSDLSWSVCPGCDQFLLPTKGSDPKIITYNEMYYEIPEVLRNKGLGLYMYHAYCDSLGITGHNDNLKTIKSGHDGTQTILNILNGDYSDVENPDAFNAQLKSFDLSCFPQVDQVNKMILNDFPTVGKIGTIGDFKDFCVRHGVKGISDSYYNGLSCRFDVKLFSGK
jgi:5'-3' exonuclease